MKAKKTQIMTEEILVITLINDSLGAGNKQRLKLESTGRVTQIGGGPAELILERPHTREGTL